MSKINVLTRIKRRIWNFIRLPQVKNKYSSNDIRQRKIEIGRRRRIVEKKRYYDDFWRSPRASFIYKEILDAFQSVVLQDTATLQRSTNKTMVTTIYGNDHLTKRITHMIDVANNARKMAEALGLNGDLAYIGGLFHDLGHTFNGHLGERMLSNISENYGFGFVCHNALGVETLVNKRVAEKVKARLKIEAPDISEQEIDDAILKIYDCILSHNGEGVESFLSANFDKTDEEFWKDFRLCYIERKYDRKITPMTLEAAVIKFADVITYVASDLLDAFRSGVVEHLNEDYLKALEPFGITEEFLNTPPQDDKKTQIADMIRSKLMDDLIDNSDQPGEEQRKIGLSKKMAEAMYNLRNANYTNFVMKCTKPLEVVILPEAVNRLNKIFAHEILNSSILKQIIHRTSNIGRSSSIDITEEQQKILNDLTISILNLSNDVKGTLSRDVRQSLDVSIDEEIDLAIGLINGTLTKEQENIYESIISRGLTVKLSKIERFKRNIQERYNGVLTEEQKASYKHEIFSKVNLTLQESEDTFRDKLRAENPNATEDEIQELFTQGYETSRLITYEELLAMRLASQYISGSSDGRIKKLIRVFGIATEEQLTRGEEYSDDCTNSSLQDTIKQQEAEMSKHKEIEERS